MARFFSIFLTSLFDFHLRRPWESQACTVFENKYVFDGVRSMFKAGGGLMWREEEVQTHDPIQTDGKHLYMRSECFYHSVCKFGLETRERPSRFYGDRHKDGVEKVRTFAVVGEEIALACDNKVHFYSKQNSKDKTGMITFEENRTVRWMGSYKDRLFVSFGDDQIVEVSGPNRNTVTHNWSSYDKNALIGGKYLFLCKWPMGFIDVYDLESNERIHSHPYNDGVRYWNEAWVHASRFYAHINAFNDNKFACYPLGDTTPIWIVDLKARVVSVRVNDYSVLGACVFIHQANGAITVVNRLDGSVIDEFSPIDFLTQAEKQFPVQPFTFHWNNQHPTYGEALEVHSNNGIFLDAIPMNQLHRIVKYFLPEPTTQLKGDVAECKVFHGPSGILKVFAQADFESIKACEKEFMKTVPLRYNSRHKCDAPSFSVDVSPNILGLFKAEDGSIYPLLMDPKYKDQLIGRLKREKGRDVELVEGANIPVYTVSKFDSNPERVCVGTMNTKQHETELLNFANKYPDDIYVTRLDGELKYGLLPQS